MNCFSIAIDNASTQNEIDRIKVSYKQTQLHRNKPWNSITMDLEKKEQELINNSIFHKKLQELENPLHIFFTRKK